MILSAAMARDKWLIQNVTSNAIVITDRKALCLENENQLWEGLTHSIEVAAWHSPLNVK
jgi:hypothetical protein